MLAILALLRKSLILSIAKFNRVTEIENSSYKCSIKVFKIAKVNCR